MKKNSYSVRGGFLRNAKRALLTLAISSAALPASADVFQQIIDNVVARELSTSNVTSLVASAKTYMGNMKDDGSWPDVNYASKAQTNWPAMTHLNRLKALAVAYVAPESALKGDEEVYDQIVSGLNYWYAMKPSSTNWWYWEIGWPQEMGVILCLMRSGEKQLPEATEKNILAWQKSISKGPNQSGSQGSGANKMDIALQWIYRTALQKDKSNLDFAVNQFFLPVKFNTGEGLQSDYSYLQHGMQLYAGGYGGSVLTATIKVAYYLVGTSYAEQGDYLDYISGFVRYGYLPSVRGQYMSFNNVGRSVALPNGMLRSSFSTITTAMTDLDRAHAEEFNAATLRLKGSKRPDYGVAPFHRHYWRADYTVHQRPGYNIDVRTASTRTLRCENGNGANLKGYFLTEGSTWIARTGKEYADISVVWDWAHLPGTTVPSVSAIPQPRQWGTKGQSTFTGGVSDGTYGVMTYQMNNTEYALNTQAKKSWFFFDNEVVCLGSDIRSSNANAVHTTINQCLSSGPISLAAADGRSSETLTAAGQVSRNDVAWVNHDSISYFFPQGGEVVLSDTMQSGTWKSVDSASSNTTMQKKRVFKLYLNHGKQPSCATYAYYIVPNTGNISDARERIDSLLVVNTDSVQAVFNPSLGMLQAVFHRAAKLKVGEMEVSATAPCAALFREVNAKEVRAFVSDPSYALDSLTIYAKFPALKYKELKCKFNTETMYKGSTSAFVVNESTPDSVYRRVDTLALSASELSFGKTALSAQLKAAVLPLNATRPLTKWESSNNQIVRVDQNGRVLALRSGEADVKVSVDDGLEATCHVVVAPGVATSFATADAYVYDKQGTTNFGSAPTLVVRNDGTNYRRAAYVRFPLEALDSLDLTAGKAEVKLLFQVLSGSEKVSEVKWTVSSLKSQAWTENAVTWNNGPSVLSQQTTSPCFIPSKDWTSNFVTFDVTSYALSRYKSGAKDLSVYIYQNARATGGKGTSEFASRENAAGYIFAPRLVVVGSEQVTGISSPATTASAPHAALQGDIQTMQTSAPEETLLYNVGGVPVRAFRVNQPGICSYNVATLSRGVYFLKMKHETIRLIKR